MKILSFCVFLFCACFIVQINAHEKELLMNVKRLYFHENQLATSRKSARISQMTCTGGHCQYSPHTIICDNIGINNDVIWQCYGKGMNRNWEISQTVVSCEGYAYETDPYILKDSCGIYYEVTPTDTFITTEDIIFFVVFCTVLATALWFFFLRPSRSHQS